MLTNFTLNLGKKNLSLTFTICFLGTLLHPDFFPLNHLTYFAPFLICYIYQKQLHRVFWMAFFCGILTDLLSSNLHFGIFTLNYCLTIWALYHQKHRFFADSPTTLPIMSFLFGVISTLFQLILTHLFQKGLSPHFTWVLTDIFVYPFIDALFAFVVFILPALLTGKRAKRGEDYFSEEARGG